MRFLSWLLNVGKNVEKATGYSDYTVYGTAYRTARFDKWRWEHRGGYSMPPSENEAQAFVEWLAFQYDQSETAKGKLQEGVRRYNKWLRHEKNYDEWEFDYQFDSSGGNHQPQDFLSREERKQVRQAVLTIGEIPSPGELTSEERDGWLTHAGQYQPEAAGMLRETEPPTFVAGVGKPRTYETDDGNVNVSVRPEHLTIVNQAIRDRWVTETAERTLDRIERFDDEANEYARMAREQYGEMLSGYREAVVSALESLDEA